MQDKNYNMDVPVRYIKGVGPKKAELFKKLGIENVSDLFYYLPRRYEDSSDIVGVDELVPEKMQAAVGVVAKTNIFRAATGTVIYEVEIHGNNKRVFAVWYNQPYMKNVFAKGQKVLFYGKVELQRHLQISHPVYEIIEEGDIKDSLDIGRIAPVYSVTENLNQKYMRKVVHQAIKSCLSNIKDPLPTPIRARRKLVDFKFAVENIHFPYSFENLERAYKRLVFEEFFILQLVMAIRRKKIVKKGISHEIGEGLLADFKKLFSFDFTQDQKNCIKEIGKDMSSEKPMYRLLQGEVGSGKTVVAMYALLLTVKNGYQGAIMVPTEILARQHYVTISKALMPLGLNVRLLINGLDSKSKDIVSNELMTGEADIVIGTHSLIQEKMNYNNLGLVIVDEQHKFGVKQRKSLMSKGRMPDTLMMTATPIPRSLVLTIYGDMDVSILKDKPAGRKETITYWVGNDRRDNVYDFIRSEVEKGHQAFIVYPRIKESLQNEIKSAEKMYKEMKEDTFKDLKVALIHGKMKTDQKKKTMEDFRRGKFDVLVATTVIEVGVDIPNVTIMVIEHAERYGLSQLHQLRGRIGRGKKQSYCILMGDSKTDSSEERLSAMEETNDGFKIAEKDLDIRGPGEVLGTRQSGLPEIRFGNIARDFVIMQEAREEAFNLIEEDPILSEPHNIVVRENIKERFKGKFGIS